MSSLQENNPEISHKGIVFQEYNTGVCSTRTLVLGRCQFLINKQVDGPFRIDESKLTYRDGMFPID